MSQKATARRKPTKGDLIALVNLAAHEAGSALNVYHDDRQPDRAGEMQRRLGELQRLMLEAASHYPPPRASPWTPPTT